ncbi:MAG: IclR family transcriptional regulator [Vitreoscilla sp.]|nr:IclR family transcriptional regulator [Polaromonas sp.]
MKEQNDTEPQRAGIQSVEVGFGLLDVLSNAGSALMLRDLAFQADMSAAKAHRYLVSFQRLGLVVQDAGTTRYDLGPAALKLGLASLSRIDAVKLARERLSPLMSEIGQTLALAVWGNQGPCMVHWEESPQTVSVNLRLGDVMPLLSSATGLCFAAFMGTRQVAVNTRLKGLLKDELARAQKLGRNDLPANMAEVSALLDEARKHGVGRVVNTLLPGVGGFCAPVFDADGHMVLGMVALGSLSTFDAEWRGAVATPLRAAARQLSSDLGYIAA